MKNNKEHSNAVQIRWTGNLGEGTSTYRAYERSHEISARGKPTIPGSSDPAFRGDPSRYNPEELLVASMSACHMLWYLHLCANAKIVVVDYVDHASGTVAVTPEGGGCFTGVTLRPTVTIQQGGDPVLAEQLQKRSHELCFIANSVNFPVGCEPSIQFEQAVAESDGG